jgi:hypothetical protein
VWKGWLVFYFASALLFVALFGIAYYAIKNLGGVGGLVVGPLLAAAIFIYGRLLGRLAWLILNNDELGETAGEQRSDKRAEWQIGRRRDRQARQLFRGLP